jgi:ubiquinone/menaquinone biosynthesis C-methylase UbiE
MTKQNFLKIYLEDYYDQKWLGNIDVCIWRSLESKLLAESANRINLNNSMKILDTGCGDGYFTSKIFDTEDITGIDISAQDIEKAKISKHFTKLINEDITQNTSLPENYFHFTYSNCVLEHVDNIHGALKEISRTLQKGGWLYLSLPMPCFANDIIWARLYRFVNPKKAEQVTQKINEDYNHKNLLPPSQWYELLKNNGFENIQMIKSVNHMDMLVWDFFRQNIPNKILRLFALLFGKKAAVYVTMSLTKKVYNRYSIKSLGEINDNPTHNGLIILCQKNKL